MPSGQCSMPRFSCSTAFFTEQVTVLSITLARPMNSSCSRSFVRRTVCERAHGFWSCSVRIAGVSSRSTELSTAVVSEVLARSMLGRDLCITVANPGTGVVTGVVAFCLFLTKPPVRSADVGSMVHVRLRVGALETPSTTDICCCRCCRTGVVPEPDEAGAGATKGAGATQLLLFVCGDQGACRQTRDLVGLAKPSDCFRSLTPPPPGL
mmetsp:Transcript_123204/g.245296  ORF Transcript_123204/g.245296 Transcript_123204/m.245296 type:complete len:209 (+) Transcript_123204:2930-3556(+)